MRSPTAPNPKGRHLIDSDSLCQSHRHHLLVRLWARNDRLAGPKYRSNVVTTSCATAADENRTHVATIHYLNHNDPNIYSTLTMPNVEVIAYNAAALLCSLFLLERGADAFIDHTALLARRTNIPQSAIALLTAGAEWEEVSETEPSIRSSDTDLCSWSWWSFL